MRSFMRFGAWILTLAFFIGICPASAASTVGSVVADAWPVMLGVDSRTAQDQEQASPAHVDAAFSASVITIDGCLDEEGWRMSGRVLTAEKQLFAEYGFQWDQTQLFAAVAYIGEEAPLELTLGKKRFTVQNGKLLEGDKEVSGARIAAKNGVVEMAIPMRVLGLGGESQ